MSKFSELLSEYVQMKGVKIYSLAKYCGLDRSTMYKVINGKRTLSDDTKVEKICGYMQLNPTEQSRLKEAYDITTLGAETYYRRKAIKELFEEFQEKTHQCKKKPMIDLICCVENEIEGSLEGVYCEEYQIGNIVSCVLRREMQKSTKKLRLILQPDGNYIQHILSEIYKYFPEKAVEQLFFINKNEMLDVTKKSYNIKCLGNLLKLYTQGDCYSARFYYDDLYAKQNVTNLLPYMILTSECVILISADLKNAYLSEDKIVLNMFSGIYDECFCHTKPFMDSTMNIEKYKWIINEIVESGAEGVLFCESPYLLPILDERILKEAFIDGEVIRNVTRQQMVECIEQAKLLLKKGRTKFMFSKQGIRDFCRTGCIKDLLPYTITLKKKSRISVLKRLLQLVDYYDVRIFRGEYTTILKDVGIYTDGQIGYIAVSGSHNQKKIFEVNDPEIVIAFKDYFENLDEKVFCDTKETKDFIEYLMKEVEKEQ